MSDHGLGHAKYPRYIWRKTLALGLLRQYVPPPASFLELGCGAGDFGLTLGQRGYTGTMTDFSEHVRPHVEAARQRMKSSNVDFVIADLRSEWPKIHPQVIIAFEVLEHLADDHELVDHVARELPIGGFFLFSVPARRHFWGDTDIAAGHYRRYERDEVRQLMQQHGLEPVALWSYGWPFLLALKVLRDRAFRRAAQARKGESHDERSQSSGIHVRGSLAGRLMGVEWLWWPFISISRLFNRFDWAEGYLCLAKKPPHDY